MTLSPQSQSVYKILLRSSQAHSARQLAAQLHIAPATFYRLAEPLIDMGLVTRNNERPQLFQAKKIEDGLSLFLLSQTDWFSEQFSDGRKNAKDQNQQESQGIQFSFVQSRDELMNSSAEEIRKANKSVDLLRSGHEIPAEVMLETIKARKRNVVTRMLIQDYDEDNAGQVDIWKKNGILVRKTPFAHIRLMIYDAKTVYFMSYKHSDSQKDLGMKIVYSPFAAILSRLFSEWWEKAKRI